MTIHDFGPLRPWYQRDAIADTDVGRRLFRTIAGEDAYPTPPANSFRVEWLRDVTFDEAPGETTLTIPGTLGTGVVYNLPGFLAEGTVGIACKIGGRWFAGSGSSPRVLFIGARRLLPDLVTLLAVDPLTGDVLWTKELGQCLNTVCDSAGNVWVSGDAGSERMIRQFDVSGNLLREWETAKTIQPHAVEIDAAGNVYCGYSATSINNPLFFQKHDSAGNVLWSLDHPDPANGSAPNPAVDPATGNVYLAKYYRNAAGDLVTVYDSEGAALFDFESAPVAGSVQGAALCVCLSNDGAAYVGVLFVFPFSIVLGYLRKYNAATGALVWEVGTPADSQPYDVECDAAGNVFLACAEGATKYDADGNLLWTDGGNPARAVTVDGDGNVYSVDNGFGTPVVRKLDAEGNLTTSYTHAGAGTWEVAIPPGRVPIFQ